MSRPARHHGHARGFDRHFHIFNRLAKRIEVVEFGQRTFCIRLAGAGGGRFVAVTLRGQFRRLQFARRNVAIRFRAAHGAVGFCKGMVRVASRPAGRSHAFCQALQFRTQHLVGLRSAI